MKKTKSFPVAPDSVYVWRGFMAPPPKTYLQFADFLGSVFVPACALLQPEVGLRAYLPTMVPQEKKPNELPDQTALMFWDTPQSHDLANKALAIRIYQNLHGDVYDMTRSKLPEVPKAFPVAKEFTSEQPYYLVDTPADWMPGSVHHVVGSRPSTVSKEDFKDSIYKWASNFKENIAKEIDAALLCAGDDYVVIWIHSERKSSNLSSYLEGFIEIINPQLSTEVRSLSLKNGLWNDWQGLDLTAPENRSLNFQFKRQKHTIPQKYNSINPVEHYEVPHLALWKSSAAKVLAKHSKSTKTTACGVDSDHAVMEATDLYCKAMEKNQPLKDPGHESTDQAAVNAYLSYLHHRKAHARIANDKDHEAELEKQIAMYKFGNPLWQQMFIQYYKYYWQYPYHKGARPVYRSWKGKEYGNGNLQYGVIDWKLPADARIAIVGDIGTGTDVGTAVLTAALNFKPDAILHLGDVYYSGTRMELKKRLVGMIRKVMKTEKCEVPFFTVPGNHEYFTGAVALLNTLDSKKLIYEESQKQAASYFCLRSEDDGWQFLGLDTGYNGHYMNVAKGAQKATLDLLHIGPVEKPQTTDDPHWPTDHNPYFLKDDEANLPQIDTTKPVPMVTVRPDETEWHQDKLENFSGRSVLLSHHQLYSALNVCGIPQKTKSDSTEPDSADFNRTWVNTGLWKQFGSYFEDKVAAWIWGHEHNLCIYEDNYRPSDWPQNGEAKTIFKNLPKGRCAGHSAIPVQDSEEPYMVNYPVPLVSPDTKLGLTQIGKYNWYNHGFQIMELRGAGNSAQLSYYQIEADIPKPLPVYKEDIN